MLDKPRDVTIVLPPFILEDIAIDGQEMKGSSVPIHEGDSQVSDTYDDDDFPQVDAELHKFAEQKLSEIDGDHLFNLRDGDESDYTEVIVAMIVPVAIIGGGEIFREVISSDLQMPGVDISELLSAIPEGVISEEEMEVITFQPANHIEEVSEEGDTVDITRVAPVIPSVKTVCSHLCRLIYVLFVHFVSNNVCIASVKALKFLQYLNFSIFYTICEFLTCFSSISSDQNIVLYICSSCTTLYPLLDTLHIRTYSCFINIFVLFHQNFCLII